MSDATHRIEISHDPHSRLYPFDARVFRLTDDQLVQVVPAETADEADRKAREWVRDENSRIPIRVTFYVDDAGEVAADPSDPLLSDSAAGVVERIADYGRQVDQAAS